MLNEAAAKIDWGLGNEVAEDSSEAAQNPLINFQPINQRTRSAASLRSTTISLKALLAHLAGQHQTFQMRLRLYT